MLELATMTAEPREASTRSQTKTVPPLGFSTALRRGRILIVDDENGPRQALRMLLKEDHEVFLASSVAAAMEFLQGETVDIVITDIRMPQQSGVELLRQVKSFKPEIDVIILTGYGELNTAMEAIEYGAFAYLEKPFDSRVMMAKIEACLDKQRREQERRALEVLSIEANRMETLGKLVSGAMHDLGTPLSVLGTHLDLLIQNPNREDIGKRLETMMSQVQHCNDLVRTTMNFLRHSPTEAAPFSLNGAAKMCIEVAKPLMLSQNVAMAADFCGHLPVCEGDLVHVRQAILNIIYNACQAMEGQEEPRQLRIETYCEGGRVCLAVQDSGPGVPEENRRHIFDALFTTKGTKGTGLGLAVVRNVMERHGGRVFLEDTSGRGARFVLAFPVAEGHEVDHL